jgi:archaellum component FlaC
VSLLNRNTTINRNECDRPDEVARFLNDIRNDLQTVDDRKGTESLAKEFREVIAKVEALGKRIGALEKKVSAL